MSSDPCGCDEQEWHVCAMHQIEKASQDGFCMALDLVYGHIKRLKETYAHRPDLVHGLELLQVAVGEDTK
jgi:hypothetical protein